MRMRLDGDGRLHLDGPVAGLGDAADAGLLHVAAGEFLRVSADDGRLRVVMHAVMGDHRSCALLMRELLALLDGQPLDRAMSKRALLAAVAACSFDPERPDAQTDRAFWWYSLSEGAASVPFARRSRALLPAGVGSDHGDTGHLDTTLPGGLDEATLLQALASALRSVTDSAGAVLIDCRRSLRADADPLAVGPFEIDQPLRVTSDIGDRIGGAALRRTLERADQHQAFDSLAAAQEFAPSYAQWGLAPAQVLVEFGADLTRAAPQTTRHDLWLQVDQTGPDTRVRLVYDRDVLEDDQAAALVSELQGGLTRATHLMPA